MNKEKLLEILKKFLSNRRRAVVIVLIVLCGFLGWRIILSKKAGEPQLQTTPVERGTIISSVSASGNVIVSNIINITTKASGIVREVYVEEGDEVSVGQEIAEIELDLEGQQSQAQAWSSYLSAKNSLETAKATQYSLQAAMFEKWDTFRELAESESYDTPEERSLPEFHIPEKEWLAAEAKYKNHQAEISQAQTAVNSAWLSYQEARSVITAPVSGTITGLMIAEGMQLGGELTSTGTRTSQRAAAIVSKGNPLASFNVSEIDVSLVESGQKVTITLDSIPDKTFTGKVVSVDKVGSITSGVTNYPIVIQFDTSSSQILPNMTATAEIIIEIKESVLWVPSQAVRTQAGQTIVKVLVNGRSQERQVEVGLETTSQAEIISGLSKGETVVVSEVVTGEETTFGGGGMRGIMPGGGFEVRR